MLTLCLFDMTMPSVIFLGFVVDHINFDSLLDTPTHEERTVDHFADCSKRNRSGINAESPFPVLATTASPQCVGNGRFIVQPNSTNNNRNLFASNYDFVQNCSPYSPGTGIAPLSDLGNGNWRIALLCRDLSGIGRDNNITSSCASLLNIQDIENRNGVLTPITTCSLNGKSITDDGQGQITGIPTPFRVVCVNVVITSGPDFTWNIAASCSRNDADSDRRNSTVTFSCYDFLNNITSIVDDDGILTAVRGS